MKLEKIKTVLKKCSVKESNINTYAPLLFKYFDQYGIKEDRDQAFFIANTLHETALYTTLSESLNYTWQTLLKVFPNRISNERLAKSVGRSETQKADQVTIARLVYGGRFGNDYKLDPYNFRGKGLLQTTFRNNYQNLKDATGIDVINEPDLLLDSDMAVKSACVFYKNIVLGKVKTIEESRKKINGGINGLEDVKRLYEIIIKEI